MQGTDPAIRLAIIGNPDSPHVKVRVERFKKKNEFTVELFNPSDADRTSAEQSRLEKILRWIPKMDTLFWLARRYRALQQFRPDVVFIMYADSYTLFLSSFLSASVVVSAWGKDLLKEQGALATPTMRMMSRRGLKKAKAIFVVSDHLKSSIIEFMRSLSFPEPVVLHYGIDLEKYRYEPPIKKKSESETKRKIQFFSPRWPLPIYNTGSIITAFIDLCKQEDSAHLFYRDCDIAGSERAKVYADSLKLEIEKSGYADQITALGLMDDENLIEVYNTADVIVSLSRSDGTPLSVLEAMALGKIAVCHRIPSLEAIIDHGVNGFLVDGENREEVTAMFKYIIDEYDKIAIDIGASARKYVEEHANVEREVEVYTNEFKKLKMMAQ